jgi:hypothetical protein
MSDATVLFLLRIEGHLVHAAMVFWVAFMTCGLLAGLCAAPVVIKALLEARR